MKLSWHAYRYYPYERQLALREAASLLGAKTVRETATGIELAGVPDSRHASRLVYFSQIHRGKLTIDTVQGRLERAASAGRLRQATRYSVHGLHEFKGKFNPQIAKAILNIFGVHAGDRVFDPFSGSGTTLVECAHIGAQGLGTDLNPFAVFLANTKLAALTTPASKFKSLLNKLRSSISRRGLRVSPTRDDERHKYLAAWFDPAIFSTIESVRAQIEITCDLHAPVFLAIASNLLRDYSQQDPNDLRIRRRSSPLPETPFRDAFLAAAVSFLDRLEQTQTVVGLELPRGCSMLCDITALSKTPPLQRFDAAITSPPYATALPYIDTQRLSLVWLGLIAPGEISQLEADLIGSREIRGQSRPDVTKRLSENIDRLPTEQFTFCKGLEGRLGRGDGFRRKAVPGLLYRYFADMQASFRAIRERLKSRAPYALIVGHNHTVLGGIRQDIDTPRHLAALAAHTGWQVEELIELQTYRRYGYHMDNAVAAETLILLRNP